MDNQDVITIDRRTLESAYLAVVQLHADREERGYDGDAYRRVALVLAGALWPKPTLKEAA